MKRSAIASIVAGAVAGLLLMPKVADAAQEIFISNDSNHPVPTKAIGTTAVSGAVSVTGGSVNVSGGSVGISGPVTVGNDSGSPIPVVLTGASAPVEFQMPVAYTMTTNSSIASAFVWIPDDVAMTIERISASDFFGNRIIDLTVAELCDFTDGKFGFGGAASVPVSATLDNDSQGIDHATHLIGTPGACFEIFITFENVFTGSSGSGSVTISGTSTPVGTTATASRSKSDELSTPSGSDRLSLSLDDPALKGLVSDEQLAQARAAVAAR